MNDKNRFRINNIHISNTNPKDAFEKIVEYATSGHGGYICVSNLRMVLYAGKHPEYADLMEHSLMNFPDGKPLTWCGRMWGIKKVHRTCGPDFFAATLRSGNQQLKHYLLGDTEEVIRKIVEKNSKETKSQIVGAESLPFTDVDNFDYRGIAERIKASGANVVWTAMRAPKQDQFNQILYKHLPNVVSIGVGRAFRIYINEIKDAPKWTKELGLSGLFISRDGFFKDVKWYTTSLFRLMGFFAQILKRRMGGKKYYE